MKKQIIVFGLMMALFSIAVFSYEMLCFDRGEMILGYVECQSDCCQTCVTDTGYQTLPQYCLNVESCTCDGQIDNPPVCIEDWTCSSWSPCTEEGTQTRICVDDNGCGTEAYRPLEFQFCSYEDPIMADLLSRVEALESDVSALQSAVSTLQSLYNSLQNFVNNLLLRIVALEEGSPVPEGCAYDNPSCGTGFECINNNCELIEDPQPPACVENWSCTSWGVCEPTSIMRMTCTDLNSCGTTVTKPAETQYCEYVEPEDTVKFRTNVLSGAYWNSNSEIVFDFDGDGNLDCLKYASFHRYYTNRLPEIMAYTPEGYEVHRYSTDRVIIRYRDNYIFQLSNNCVVPLSKFPVEPYATNNQEVYN